MFECEITLKTFENQPSDLVKKPQIAISFNILKNGPNIFYFLKKGLGVFYNLAYNTFPKQICPLGYMFLYKKIKFLTNF